MNNDPPPGRNPRTAVRPKAVTRAVLLFGLVIILNVAGPLLPSSEGEVAFGVVSAVLAIVAAAGLWMLRRWGYIAAVVVAGLNVLLDLPAIFVVSTGLLKIAGAVVVLVCVLIIVLVTRPEARRAYR